MRLRLLAPALLFVPLLATEVVATDPVIGAVGDMACDPADSRYNGGSGVSAACKGRVTSSAMLADASLTAILGLGDYQYDCSDPADWNTSYNPTWGRLDGLMRPVVGNHEYKTGTDRFGVACPASNSSAATYFAHFGASAHAETKGHFSLDLGSWHLIALNGNCARVGGCGTSSPQSNWLRADLAATTQPCILAFWHQPLFTGSSGIAGNLYKPWWDILYAAHADVVVNGHAHNYQRYAALSPSGAADPVNGITEYVVGTGGEELISVKPDYRPQPVSWRRAFGYLRLTLHPESWDQQFVDVTGSVIDSSTGICHPQ